MMNGGWGKIVLHIVTPLFSVYPDALFPDPRWGQLSCCLPVFTCLCNSLPLFLPQIYNCSVGKFGDLPDFILCYLEKEGIFCLPHPLLLLGRHYDLPLFSPHHRCRLWKLITLPAGPLLPAPFPHIRYPIHSALFDIVRSTEVEGRRHCRSPYLRVVLVVRYYSLLPLLCDYAGDCCSVVVDGEGPTCHPTWCCCLHCCCYSTTTTASYPLPTFAVCWCQTLLRCSSTCRCLPVHCL